MSKQESLNNHSIAISLSESPNMNVLGLSAEHLVDAMAEVARHLLAKGANLLYGGDLRPGGFTEVLFELVTRYCRESDIDEARPRVKNVLAWPVHISQAPEKLEELSRSLDGVAELIYLSDDGRVLPAEMRPQFGTRPASENEWRQGLTAMRSFITQAAAARIVLGGKTANFKGKMPGIAEEALGSLQVGQPLFIVGGFGGCARDLAQELGLLPLKAPALESDWIGRGDFRSFHASQLNNGLDQRENQILATTVHIDQAVALILRGLLRKREVVG